MGTDLTLYYYHKDELCTVIKCSGRKVSFVNYTDDYVNKAFGNQTSVTYDEFEHFLESRCFPRTRANAKDILNYLGLDFYYPLSICMKTHGVLYDDFSWIKFEGENITWKDVKIRG